MNSDSADPAPHLARRVHRPRAARLSSNFKNLRSLGARLRGTPRLGAPSCTDVGTLRAGSLSLSLSRRGLHSINSNLEIDAAHRLAILDRLAHIEGQFIIVGSRGWWELVAKQLLPHLTAFRKSAESTRVWKNLWGGR